MSIYKMGRIRLWSIPIIFLLGLLFFLSSSETALACTSRRTPVPTPTRPSVPTPVPTPMAADITISGDPCEGEVEIIVHDYTTFGAGEDEFCTCALNLPTAFGEVTSAQLIVTETGNPLAGFSFSPNPESGQGFNQLNPLEPPEQWNGFSSAVTTNIPADIPIDLVLTVKTGNDSTIPCEGYGERLVRYMEQAEALVGTSGANRNGIPDHHTEIVVAGRITDLTDQNQDIPGEIHGAKWHDLNQNGIWDAGEPTLAGWSITLQTADGSVLDVTTTDANGGYWFMDIPPGEYIVTEEQQSGWIQIFPTDFEGHLIQLDNGQVVEGIDFGNVQEPGSIHGVKWHDLNENGIRDVGEPTLAGWSITLQTADGSVLAVTTTDANGEYWFMDLAPGNYVVTEELQSGWTQTFPAAPGEHSIQLDDGQVVEGIDFGNIQEQTGPILTIEPVDDSIQILEPNVPRTLSFEVKNLTDDTQSVVLQYHHTFSVGGQMTETLEIGGAQTAWEKVELAPRQTLRVPIPVALVAPTPNGAGEVILSVDINDDDQPDITASIPVQATSRPQPSCLRFDGLQSCTTGDARLPLQGDSLTVSNIGSSGQDGINIDLGESEYGLVTIADIEMDGADPGSTLNFTAVNQQDNNRRPLSSIQLKSVNGRGMLLSADMSPLGIQNPTVRIYDDSGGLVGTSDINEVTIVVPPTLDCDVNPFWPMGDVLVARMEMPETVEVTLADGSTVQGSRIDFVGEGLTAELDPVTQIEARAAGFPSFALAETETGLFGLAHSGIGGAHLEPSDDHLNVTNFSDDGQAGVSIDLEEANRWQATIEALDPEVDPTGTSLTMTHLGEVGDNDEPIGELKFVDRGDVVEYSADYSAIGNETFIIEASQGNNIVQEIANHPGNGIMGPAHWVSFYFKIVRINGQIVYIEWCFFWASSVALNIDGTEVEADTLMIRTASPLSEIGSGSEIIIQAAGIDGLTIFNEEATVVTTEGEKTVVIGNVDGSDINVVEGQAVNIPISIQDIPADATVGAVTLEVHYDDSVVEPATCGNHPDQDFTNVLCNLSFAPGIVRLNGTSELGVSGTVNLALIKWQTVGSPGDSTTLVGSVQTKGDTDGIPLDHITQDQTVNIKMRGDVNCDGVISSVDGLFVLQHDLGLRQGSNQCPPEQSALYLPACDVNNDGICGAIDALFMLQCDIGRANSLCPNGIVFSSRVHRNSHTVKDAITQIEPTLQLELPAIAAGSRFTATVRAAAETELGAVTGIINYDPTRYRVAACHAILEEGFSGGCNPTYGEDTVRFNLVMPSGGSNTLHVADIGFEHVGDGVDISTFEIEAIAFADLDGKSVNVTPEVIDIVVPLNQHWIYLPAIEK